MPTMTRYEKLSIILATIALLLAIASPLVSYYWLDPQLQAFRNRAVLQVVGESLATEKDKSWARFVRERSEPSPGATPEELDDKTVSSLTAAPFEVEVTNTGKLPAKDIKILLQYWHNEYNENERDFLFQFDSPLSYDVVNKHGQRL